MKEKKKVGNQQLYCKEKNLLQLPIFYFDKSNEKEVTISWQEEDGRKCEITCCSSEGLPGSLEQDIYATSMRLWVIQGMSIDGIEVQYSNIAQILNLNLVHWKTKIIKSLLKLGAARYKFTECFIIGSHFSFSLKNMDLYRCLIIRRG